MDEPHDKPLRFYSAFWPVLRVTAIWSSTLAILAVLVISFLEGFPARVPELAIIGTCTILCGVLVALAIVCFPIQVRVDGLKCYDFYGSYRLARWESIRGGRAVNMIGLRYLLVDSPDLPRPQWLPLFLSDMDGFMTAIYERVGGDHPLMAALEASRR